MSPAVSTPQCSSRASTAHSLTRFRSLFFTGINVSNIKAAKDFFDHVLDVDKSKVDAGVMTPAAFDIAVSNAVGARQRGGSMLPLTVTPPSLTVKTKPFQNDKSLMAYKQCPKFDESTAALKQSAAWTALVGAAGTAQHSVLIKLGTDARLATIVQKVCDEKGIPGVGTAGPLPLDLLKEVYDYISAARSACGTANVPVADTACAILFTDDDANAQHGEDFAAAKELDIRLVLTDAEYATMRSLAHAATLLLFSKANGVDKLGAPLVNEITTMMHEMIMRPKNDDPTKQFATPPPPRFVMHSGHEESFMSVVGALGLEAHNPTVDFEIPGYGAGLIFELWDSTPSLPKDFITAGTIPTGRFFVGVVGAEGADDSKADSMTPADLAACTATETCPPTVSFFENNAPLSLNDFVAWQQRSLALEGSTDKAWCDACGNTLSNVCLEFELAAKATAAAEAQAAAAAASGKSEVVTDTVGVTLVLVVVCPIVAIVSAVLGAFVMYIVVKKRAQRAGSGGNVNIGQMAMHELHDTEEVGMDNGHSTDSDDF